MHTDLKWYMRCVLITGYTFLGADCPFKTNPISVVSISWNWNLNKRAALVPPAVVMHTKHVTLLNISYLDLITFHLTCYLGNAISHIHLSVVSDSLCLHFSRSLFLVQKHTDTHPNLLPVLSASPQPLYKGAFLRGPWSLPEDYQWRQSTLMLLLHAEISTNRIEGKVETKRETRRKTVKFRKTDRQWGKVWWALHNYKSV